MRRNLRRRSGRCPGSETEKFAVKHGRPLRVLRDMWRFVERSTPGEDKDMTRERKKRLFNSSVRRCWWFRSAIEHTFRVHHTVFYEALALSMLIVTRIIFRLQWHQNDALSFHELRYSNPNLLNDARHFKNHVSRSIQRVKGWVILNSR